MRTSSTSARAYAALGGLIVGYLLLVLIAGAPESPLVPLLPAEVGVPSWTVRGADLIGLDAWNRTELTILALCVMAALVASFVVVLLEAWRGRVGLAPVLVAVTASLVMATAAPLLLSRDVDAYAAYGRIVAVHDSNPYVDPPSAFPSDPFARVAPAVWADTPSLYGPAFTLLSAGVASSFADSPEATILSFKLLAGVAMALSVLLLTMTARALRPGREPLAAAALGLNPVIVVHTVGGGHNDAIIAALLAGALLAVSRTRVRGATIKPLGPTAFAVTVLLSLCALIKVVMAIPLLLWIWALAARSGGEARTPVLVVHVGLGALIGAALFAPFFDGLRSLRAAATLASVEGWASGPGLVARGAREIGEALVGDSAGDLLARIVAAAFLLIVAIGLLRVAGAVAPERIASAWGAALVLFALGSPYLAPWYAAWFVPFLVLGDDRRLAITGLTASVALALTGIPAEPGPLYEGMRLAVHYVAAPVMLVLFGAALRQVLRVDDRAFEPPAFESPRTGAVPR